MSASGKEPLERRLRIARRVDRVLGNHPDVTAVYVLGSVAAAQVDEWSDVDVAVVSRSSILALSDRRERLSQIGTDWRFDAPTSDDPIWQGNAMPSADDEGVVGGVNVEIIYQSASDISEVIDEVVSRGAMSAEKVPSRPYTLVGMLRKALVLRDVDGVFAGWLTQTAVYPSRLKQNILRHFVPILRENADTLREYAERRFGPSLQLFFLSRGTDALESMLYALNEVYDPADKRAQLNIPSSLARLPNDFGSRYNYVLQGPFDDSGALERARLFHGLASEVIAMALRDMD